MNTVQMYDRLLTLQDAEIEKQKATIKEIHSRCNFPEGVIYDESVARLPKEIVELRDARYRLQLLAEFRDILQTRYDAEHEKAFTREED